MMENNKLSVSKHCSYLKLEIKGNAKERKNEITLQVDDLSSEVFNTVTNWKGWSSEISNY